MISLFTWILGQRSLCWQRNHPPKRVKEWTMHQRLIKASSVLWKPLWHGIHDCMFTFIYSFPVLALTTIETWCIWLLVPDLYGSSCPMQPCSTHMWPTRGDNWTSPGADSTLYSSVCFKQFKVVWFLAKYEPNMACILTVKMQTNRLFAKFCRIMP